MSERDRVRRWRRGHQASSAAQRELLRREGPRPQQAIAELFSALDALAEMDRWPGPRDPVSERQVEEVRRRWARIKRRAGKSRSD